MLWSAFLLVLFTILLPKNPHSLPLFSHKILSLYMVAKAASATFLSQYNYNCFTCCHIGELRKKIHKCCPFLSRLFRSHRLCLFLDIRPCTHRNVYIRRGLFYAVRLAYPICILCRTYAYTYRNLYTNFSL